MAIMFSKLPTLLIRSRYRSCSSVVMKPSLIKQLIIYKNYGILQKNPISVHLADSFRDLGYSCHDIISTMFRVTKTMDLLSEHAKLEFIRVSSSRMHQMPNVLTSNCTGNWIHSHADTGRSSNVSAAGWLPGASL
jgi:hypothetical protein